MGSVGCNRLPSEGASVPSAWKMAACVLGVTWIVSIGTMSYGWLNGYVVYRNVTSSLPPGYYLCQAVASHKPLRVGDIVSIRPPASVQQAIRPYQPPGVPVTPLWLKQVAALEGDEVCLLPDAVTVNGQFFGSRPLRAHYRAVLHFAEGCMTLDWEQVFVLGTDPYSFDNRYTGAWGLHRIQHVCRLVWAERDTTP